MTPHSPAPNSDVREFGWSVVAAALALGVSRQIVHHWLRRLDREGVAGLADRSSRPHRTPRLTRIDLAMQYLRRARATEDLGPALPGTCSAWPAPRCTRCCVAPASGACTVLRPRSACGGRVAGPGRRGAPGKIPPDGASWRNVGRTAANHCKRRAGYEYCHVAVDDHSRWPEVLRFADERPASAIAALEATVASYVRRGIPVKRVLTDNGNCYRSSDFAEACRQLGIEHWRTRPYRPRTKGKAEHFIRTLLQEWAYVELRARRTKSKRRLG